MSITGTYFVSKHFDNWGGHVGGPHGDYPLGVPQQADSIVGVVPQHITWAHLGPVLCYDVAGAGVLHTTLSNCKATP